MMLSVRHTEYRRWLHAVSRAQEGDNIATRLAYMYIRIAHYGYSIGAVPTAVTINRRVVKISDVLPWSHVMMLP